MKTPLIVIVSLLIGFAGYYAYDQYQTIKIENERLKTAQEVSSQPDFSIRDSNNKPVLVTPEPEDTVAKTGNIAVTVGYPSEGIPPLEVYAFRKEDDTHVLVKTKQNQSTVSFENMPLGTYTFVAYPQDTAKLAGGYTKAVPCGLLATCTDHSLIEVEIEEGTNFTQVEIKDWYAPEGTFPTKP